MMSPIYSHLFRCSHLVHPCRVAPPVPAAPASRWCRESPASPSSHGLPSGLADPGTKEDITIRRQSSMITASGVSGNCDRVWGPLLCYTFPRVGRHVCTHTKCLSTHLHDSFNIPPEMVELYLVCASILGIGRWGGGGNTVIKCLKIRKQMITLRCIHF